MTFALFGIFGLLFIGLGNYLPRVRPNFTFGIRTPWTLASEEVWRRTHRASGPVFVAAGIATLIAALFATSLHELAFAIMLISILGLLGLVYFETQFRRKEIAVRRVHGASVGEILLMINRYYLMITLICFIMTAPVSIVIIRHWAASFPYRSPIPVWIFLAALALITLITAVTVTLLSRSAALRNPVDSISTE